MENNTYRWAPNNSPKKTDPEALKKLPRLLITIGLVVFLVVLALTCFYTVDDKQQAVVTTFGKVTAITDAGMHFKLPFGIQQVQRLT